MNKILKNNFKKLFISLICIVALIAIAFTCCACSNKKEDITKFKNEQVGEQVQSIKIGKTLPDIPVNELGVGDLRVGDLYTSKATNDDIQQFNLIGAYQYETYINQGKTKKVEVVHLKNTKNLSLEEYTKSEVDFYELDDSSWRFGPSEMYARMGFNINDGYFVNWIPASQNQYMLIQRCIYQDADDFVWIQFSFLCENVAIEGTNINMSIPAGYNVASETKDSHKYTKYTYQSSMEVPEFSTTTTNRSFEDVLKDCMNDYNARVELTRVNNLSCCIAVSKNVASDDGRSYNYKVFVFNQNGKTVVLSFKENSNVLTHSFSALTKGLRQID